MSASNDEISDKFQRNLEFFTNKPLQCKQDRFAISFLEQQEKFYPVLLNLLKDPAISETTKSWICVFPSWMKPKIGRKFIQQLTQKTKHPNWEIRLNAINTLGILGANQAIPQMIERLADTSILIREAAEINLKKLVQKKDLPMLMRKFKNVNLDIQEKLLSLICLLQNSEARTWLVNILKTGSLRLRMIALYYFSQNRKNIPFLISLMEDPSAKIRRRVIEILGRQKSKEAIPNLAKSLEDNDPKVRIASIWALSCINTPQSLKLIRNCCKQNKKQDNELMVAELMVRGLNGDNEILPFCKNILSQQNILEYDKARLIYGLSGLGNRDTFFYLLSLMKSQSPFLKKIAEASLWKMYADKQQQQRQRIPSLKIARELNYVDTSHYRIYSDIGKDFLHKTAIMMEYLNGYYHSVFSYLVKYNASKIESLYPLKRHATNYQLAIPSSKQIVIVYIFRYRKSFLDYAKFKDGQSPFLQDSGAYYVPSRQEMIAYTREDSHFVAQTLFHEALHQTLSQYLTNCPIWLNEGMAEYFCHFKKTPEGFHTGQPAPKHIALLKKILANDSYTHLEDLLRLDHYSFHNDNFGPQELIHYAQSWSLIYFLMKSEQGKYRNVIRDYFCLLMTKKSPNFARVLEKHGITLRELEKKWQAYFLMLNF